MSNEVRTFALRKHPQDGSRLLQLPLELKIQIYSLLLAFPGHVRESDVALGYFQPQILRVCQAMYEETWSLLRTKNTFAIDLDLDQSEYAHFPEEIWVRFPEKDGTWRNENYGARRYKKWLLANFVTDRRIQWLMTNIGSFQLTLHLRMSEVTTDYLRWLILERIETNLRFIRPYVRQSEVTVVYTNRYSSNNQLLKLINQGDIRGRSFLYLFELIRCKTLTFEGVEESKSAEIRALCESSQPILDLPDEAGKAWKSLADSLRAAGRWRTAEDEALGEALGNAARRYFPEDFWKAKEQVLNRADEYANMPVIPQELGVVIAEPI